MIEVFDPAGPYQLSHLVGPVQDRVVDGGGHGEPRVGLVAGGQPGEAGVGVGGQRGELVEEGYLRLIRLLVRAEHLAPHVTRWIGSGRRPVTAGRVLRKADVPRDHGQDYPVCVEFRGDSPVEYWCEDEPEEPEPFGLNEVNQRLAALNREPT
jgi:hypothetical protein